MRWVYLTTRVMVIAALDDKAILEAPRVHYLKYTGYVMLAHQWAVQADVASKKLASASDDEKGA